MDVEKLISLAEQGRCENFSGWAWANLLREQPQFADRCNWHLFNGKNWAHLLSVQPQFADKRPGK